MKTIQLNDNWEIIADETNVELKYSIPIERTDKKTGEKKMGVSTRSYHFPSIQMCLRRFLDEEQKDCQSIQEVLDKTEEVKQIIKSLKC